MTVYRFPRGFLWGAATAAHQVEGGNRLNDWWPAEEEGRLPHRSGEACRFWDLYERDLDLARRFGHNAHRLSLEWSRIEPEPGRFDEAALDHYAVIVDAMAARGIEPVVTLHHFTSPLWFARRGGWLDRRNLAAFEAYAGKVAERLAGRVRWWITVNEPTVLAKHGFVTGDWPPFRRGRWDLALRTIRAMGRGHVLARAALRAARPDAMVSFAHSAPWIEPCNPRAGPTGWPPWPATSSSTVCPSACWAARPGMCSTMWRSTTTRAWWCAGRGADGRPCSAGTVSTTITGPGAASP
ncbi:family 1 glycosylhydrolase [Marinimicrococcus flavescens]|uniref:Family 1 glycosylhydrolase n=1 Tax=Marinimicrococcus flavescens TaxID=3031815 RepID=A0AAP3V0V7_9PROT|nr:family 1 glycosylhydrolase [Marinimicrococcus flavescens]